MATLAAWRRFLASTQYRVLALVAVGAATAATYLLLVTQPLRLDHVAPSPGVSLAVQLGGDWPALARFVATMMLLLALYAVALLLAAALGSRGSWSATALMVLLVGALLPAHPFDSADVLHYVATARLFTVYGLNPLTTPPDAVAGDAVVALAEWGHLPSPYGPLWALLSAVPRLFLGAGASAAAEIIALKALAGLGLLSTALLTGAAAERHRPGSRTFVIVLVGWSPLFLLHAAGDGHNDAVMLAFVALALYGVARRWHVTAALALVLAALVKFVPLFLLPVLLLWLWRRRRRRSLAVIGVCAPLLVMAAYAPFWEGGRTFAAGLGEGGYLTTSLHAALVPALMTFMTRAQADTMLPLAGRVAFAVLAVRAAWRVLPERSGPAQAWAETMLWYLAVGAAWLMPWYVLWALVPAAVLQTQRLGFRLAVAMSAGAMFQPVAPDYLTLISGEGDSWGPVHLVATALLFGPALVLLVVEWLIPCPWTDGGLARCGTVDAQVAGRRDGYDADTGPASRTGRGDQLHGAGTGACPRVHGEPRQG